MPLDEFRCQDCKATFETLTRHGDRPQRLTCPVCGCAADRLVSAATVVTSAKQASHHAQDKADAKHERLRLPVEKHPPQVELGAAPPLPERHKHHLFEHGSC